MRRRLLILLVILSSACGATNPPRALTQEQSAVLVAALDAAAPRTLDRIEDADARRRMRKELARLRRALEQGHAQRLAEEVAKLSGDSTLEPLLREIKSAVIPPDRRKP